MRMKRFCAIVCCAAMLLCGCGETLMWRDNVTSVDGEYYSTAEFEAWYADVQNFDELMPEGICEMLCIEGALRDESALMAFARYQMLCGRYGVADQAAASALLEELGLEEDETSLACAIIYCTIDAVRTDATADVQVSDDEVYEWYQDQVRQQMELANHDLVTAQDNYMRGAYDVTVYVPEGLKFVQVIAIGEQQEDPADAFPTGQRAWRRLIYNESFTDIFAEFNESEAYANADGTPKTFCIYEAWQEDPAIKLLAENLHQPGQMCGPTMYEGICYIVRFDAAPVSGSIAFDLVEDQCAPAALKAHQNIAWSQILDDMQYEAQVRFAPQN